MTNFLENKKIEIEQEIVTMLIGGDDSFDVQSRKKYILKHITPEMFTTGLYSVIVKAAKRLADLKMPITLDYFLAKAKQIKTLQLIDNAETLQELNDEYISSVNCVYYVRLLHELYFDAKFAQRLSYEEFKILEGLKKEVEIKNNVVKIAHKANEIISDYYSNWEKAVISGWSSLDKRVGAFLGGDFGILAGAPGMGKTATMLNMIQKMDKRGTKVLLFSLEMKLQQLQNRIISAKTQISSSKIRLFNMTPEEVRRYDAYSDSDEFKNSNITVYDNFTMTLDDIGTVIQRVAPDIVFVDYLGLITPTTKGREYDQMNEISRGLKTLAGDLNIPIIALHQLSREIAKRENKEPMMSDLRGSGHIEQDADFVFFVHRPAYFNPTLNPNELKFIIGKSRHTGGNKYFTLSYDAKTQKITDPAGDTQGSQCGFDIGGGNNGK